MWPHESTLSTWVVQYVGLELLELESISETLEVERVLSVGYVEEM